MFDKYDDFPYDTHCHLLALEVWIGSLDGMDLTNWHNGEGSEMHGIDEGTIDAEDAVRAVNALIACIRFLKDRRAMAFEDCTNAAQGVTAARYAEKSADWQEGFDRGGNAAAQAIRELLNPPQPSAA